MASNAERKLMRDFDVYRKKLQKVTGKSKSTILWKYSTQFANGLIRATHPRGGVKKAKLSGELAVKKDVMKAYGNIGALYLSIRKQNENLANVMWRAYKDNDFKVLQEISQYDPKLNNVAFILWDGGAHHRQGRNSRGRFTNSRGAQKKMLINKDRQKMVAYIQEVQELVGFTKAGWISNFNPPGVMRVSAYVKRNKGNQGDVKEQKRIGGLINEIVFHNKVEWIENKFVFRAVKGALRSVVNRMKKDLEKEVEKKAKNI